MILKVINKDGEKYECYGKTIEDLRGMQKKIRETKSALCPECLHPMQVRMYVDKSRTNHFYHLGDGCGYGKGESEEHLVSKTAIRRYLENRDLWNECTFEFEYRVTLASGKIKVIDLAVFHPDGRKEAHEAQLSSQGAVAFEERTEAYGSLGFTTIWWLGSKNSKYHDWCYKNCGWAGQLEIEERPINFGWDTYQTGKD